MSEYQYYEFQAVDRPLTQAEMGELRAHSTRATITPSSFVNEYNWGDFKGDPDKWMEKYFDAFVYLASWGTRRFTLRVPRQLLDANVASCYCIDESLCSHTTDEHVIVSYFFNEEGPDWCDAGGWLTSLLPLRSELMNGDHRCLYLGWLLLVQEGALDDDTLEPPVPPGLADLSVPLQSLADFLQIDLDLIAAAAEQSDLDPGVGMSTDNFAKWVSELPSKDKDAVLMRMIEDQDLHVATELRQRALAEIRGLGEVSSQGSGGRSVGQLVARAEQLAPERHRKEAEAAARDKARCEREEAEKRNKYLESLIGGEKALWLKVDAIIASKHPKRYDEAVSLLHDLRDLAEKEGNATNFSLRLDALLSEHTRKPALLEKIQKSNLGAGRRPDRFSHSELSS